MIFDRCADALKLELKFWHLVVVRTDRYLSSVPCGLEVHA